MLSDLITSVMKSEAIGPAAGDPEDTVPVSAAATRADGGVAEGVGVDGLSGPTDGAAEAGRTKLVAPVAAAAARKRRRAGFGRSPSCSRRLMGVLPVFSN